MKKQQVSTYIIYMPLLCLFILAGLAGASVLTGCSSAGSDPSVKVGRLDHAFRDGWPLADGFIAPAEALFKVSGYGSLNDSTYTAYMSNPSVRIHETAVDSLWENTDRLESQLGTVKAHYARLFHDKSFPSVYAVISPFRQSVITVDTFLYVGLNHYLGENYPPYGYFPDYLRVRKIPARVIPDIVETLLHRDFPYAPECDYPTVLSRILYEGVLVEAVMQIAGVSEQTALGYDDQQMEWLNKNEHKLWEEIVGRKYLFSSDRQLASSLISPAPFTSAVGPEVPGAAGRFIGHRIIASLLDNRAVALSELLSPSFYESSTALAESKYK